jgi:hypothetical protein
MSAQHDEHVHDYLADLNQQSYETALEQERHAHASQPHWQQLGYESREEYEFWELSTDN